jgi:hypothetical protein
MQPANADSPRHARMRDVTWPLVEVWQQGRRLPSMATQVTVVDHRGA